MGTDYMTPKYMFNRDFEISIGDRGDLTEDHYSILPGITWYTDGSKTEQGTGAGIYSGMRKIELSLPLGRYTSVFQAEVYALLQCARENNLRAYRNKRINILTDSQAALKGLRNHKVTSRLLWECWEELSDLARHNRVVLLWVPGHSGIKGNEKADELARKGSSASYIGPEPAVGVSKTMVRSQAPTFFIREPSAKLTRELLTLSRNKLRIITGLLTGHCVLKAHLIRMGLYNGDPNCRLCGRGAESAYHILCECEALDHRRQTVYGRPSMSPAEYSAHLAAGLYRLLLFRYRASLADFPEVHTRLRKSQASVLVLLVVSPSRFPGVYLSLGKVDKEIPSVNGGNQLSRFPEADVRWASYKDAVKEDRRIEKELNLLTENEAKELAEAPQDKKVIDSTWVFKDKK
ncbi:hypothetical protein NQ315_002636 [Exocentrus adspersus]|uniref:ribonuclease H n=1 Tax=Exocentrus adspersus TaxID=1586481 RepID=A0AAV8VU64_9CUCU|nr:hypothetical protein NQ315_002636 [Exocentrus adspersus]